MQNNYAYKNYSRTQVESSSQNELEAGALLKSASILNQVKESWKDDDPQNKLNLNAALERNRKLWTLLVSDLNNPEHPMPETIKKNITNLAYFIFSKTFDLMFKPDKAKLDILININKNIAKGLSSKPENKSAGNIEGITNIIEQKPLANQNYLNSEDAATKKATVSLNITS